LNKKAKVKIKLNFKIKKMAGNANSGRGRMSNELKILVYLERLTPKVFKVAEDFLDNGTPAQKLAVVKALGGKIIDKGLPTELNHSGEITVKPLLGGQSNVSTDTSDKEDTEIKEED
jgi:hypothetical protein